MHTFGAPNVPTMRSTRPPTPKRGPVMAVRPTSATSPATWPSSSSSASAPSPFGDRRFIRVTSRERFRYPSRDSTSTGSRNTEVPVPRPIVSSAPTIALRPARFAAR